MSDWPKKMWLDTYGGGVFSDPTNERSVQVLVYPADQAPEPVGFTIRDNNSGEMIAQINDYSVPEYAPLYLAPPSESAFKAAVLDALTINWALKAEHETDARLAIADLIAAEIRIALDPAVSSDAQALIDKGRASERERCIRIIEQYQVPVGNSSAGEMACDWTMDALRQLREEIRELGDE